MSHASVAGFLGLYHDELMQDWPLESADSQRVREFFDVYLSTEMSDIEREILMELVMASVDNFIAETSLPHPDMDEIAKAICERYDIHRERVRHWSCLDSELDEGFPISPWMRQIMTTMADSWPRN